MAKQNPNKLTYYMDSCVFLDLIEGPADQEPARTIAALLIDAARGRHNVITSTVTISEVCFAKAEKDSHTLDPEVERKILQLWNPSADDAPLQLVDFHELIGREAMQLVRRGIGKGWSGTRGIDAIHLATAIREGADEFFTNDDKLERWGELCPFKVCKPHYEPDDDGDGASLYAPGGNQP